MHRSRVPPGAQTTTPSPIPLAGTSSVPQGANFYDLTPGEGEVGSTSMAASSSGGPTVVPTSGVRINVTMTAVGETSYEGLILYYFQNVVSYEFRFASEHILQTLQHAVIRNSRKTTNSGLDTQG